VDRTTRHSKKRDAILNAIRSTTCHPSAEWVYQTLKPSHPDLSLGTVYRNLTFFQSRGDIQSVGVVRGQERFDATTTPHTHFICTCCGAVIDLPCIKLEGTMVRDVSKQYGLMVERHELTFYGICQACIPDKQTTLS